ncbi:HD domain-containing phosphohydrolase [Amphritea sp. HPY]|uniref:HD domain-containing phosphohydrolase n=1 Tax=Amphritea sp. HPY TaxID=3421652 RepID=UPI003D7CEF1E
MKRPLLTGLICITIIVLGCFQLINYLTSQEQVRTTSHWEITLRSLADQQSQQISYWLDENLNQLRQISQNDSVRLYLQRLLEQQDQGQTELAQLTFIRNIVINSANRFGYISASHSINANVLPAGSESLAFYSANKKLITGTAGDTLQHPLLQNAFDQAITSGKAIITPLWSSPGKHTNIAFILPVKSLPAFSASTQILGAVVGIKQLEATVFPILRNNILSIKSLESSLIQQFNGQLLYASPLHNNHQALSRSVTLSEEQLRSAETKLLQAPDYNGQQSLMVTRTITDTGLSLLVKVDRAEAFQESKTYQTFISTLVLLSGLLLSAVMYAAWWYGQALQQNRSNQLINQQKSKIAYQSTLLSAINDNISDAIIISDNQRNTLFINKTLAGQLCITPEDAQNKHINALLGNNYADQLDPLINCAIEQQHSITEELTLIFRNKPGQFHITVVPIEYQNHPAAMITLHDITAASLSREKQTRLLQQIISSLMHAIDLHDPYSANHSAKTSLLALRIAGQMQLDRGSRNTLEVAANLCNLGKLFIPKELLTKTGPLSQEEKDLLQSEVTHTSEILKGIDFNGPVLETIMQKYEYLDGSGNQGLQGDELSTISRILTVANDFVAMISPRAYRNKIEPKQVLNIMYQMADSKYDRQVIATLFYIIENQLPEELLP